MQKSKKEMIAEAEIKTFREQLEPLRKERRRLKSQGLPFDEVDREIRLRVRRIKRIENKLNARGKEGCPIKAAGSSGSSRSIYVGYRDASKRPVQGGKASSK